MQKAPPQRSQVRRLPSGTGAGTERWSWSCPPCGAQNSLYDPVMGSASTEVAGECVLDPRRIRLRLTRKQGGAGHDHAIRAIAALGGLLGDERRLDLVKVLGRAEAFLRRHRAAADPRHGRPAGSDRLALDYHRACAALPEAAAELRSLQPERVAQDIKKRFVRVTCLHGSWSPIDGQVIGRHRKSPAWSVARRNRSPQRSLTGDCAMAVVLKQKSRQMDSPFRTTYVQRLQLFLLPANAKPSYRVRVASRRGLEFE